MNCRHGHQGLRLRLGFHPTCSVPINNDLWVSAIFGAMLAAGGLWLIRWHLRVWSAHRDDRALDERERRFFRVQARRRVQVGALLVAAGALIPAGDALVAARRDPRLFAVYVVAILALAAWMAGLALTDWLASSAHRRALRASLAALERKRRALEEEAARLRRQRTNGAR
jgi:hypothetical protein